MVDLVGWVQPTECQASRRWVQPAKCQASRRWVSPTLQEAFRNHLPVTSVM
jgi:hypothetical protein